MAKRSEKQVDRTRDGMLAVRMRQELKDAFEESFGDLKGLRSVEDKDIGSSTLLEYWVTWWLRMDPEARRETFRMYRRAFQDSVAEKEEKAAAAMPGAASNPAVDSPGIRPLGGATTESLRKSGGDHEAPVKPRAPKRGR